MSSSSVEEAPFQPGLLSSLPWFSTNLLWAWHSTVLQGSVFKIFPLDKSQKDFKTCTKWSSVGTEAKISTSEVRKLMEVSRMRWRALASPWAAVSCGLTCPGGASSKQQPDEGDHMARHIGRTPAYQIVMQRLSALGERSIFTKSLLVWTIVGISRKNIIMVCWWIWEISKNVGNGEVLYKVDTKEIMNFMKVFHKMTFVKSCVHWWW